MDSIRKGMALVVAAAMMCLGLACAYVDLACPLWAYGDERAGEPDPGQEEDFAGDDEAAEEAADDTEEGRERSREVQAYDEIEEGREYLIAAAADSVYMVEVAGSSLDDAATVQVYEQTAGANQRWRFVPAGDGWYAIANVNSGKVLDVAGGSTASEARIIQYENTGSDNQLWKPVRNTDGSMTFYGKSGKALGIPSTTVANTNRVWLHKNDDTVRQSFYLKVAPNEEARGHWVYKDVGHEEMVIDTVSAQQGGDAISAACVALAGYPMTKGYAPSAKSNYSRPPDEGYGGDWSVYNRVTSVLPIKYHASCDDGVSLAVRYSGADDSYPQFGPGRLYDYMMRSSKWTRVGGSGRYWHRNTSVEGGYGDSGVDIQPGDVLIRKSVESENNRTWAHCCIYVGAEKGNMKFPGYDLTYFEESFEDKLWAYLGRTDKNRNGPYCVFRRNDNGLDIAGSKWADVCPEEKARYANKLSSTWSVNKVVDQVKEDYVYDDYLISYEGLPEGSVFNGATTFTYDSETIVLETPETTEDYLFEGWFTQAEGGDRVTEIPSGTMDDITLYAHTRYLPTYTVTYNGVPDDIGAVAPTAFKETYDTFQLAQPDIPEGYDLVFDGWFDQEKDGKRVEEIARGTTEDVAVYAHWTSKWLTFPYALLPLAAAAMLAIAMAVIVWKWRKKKTPGK